MRHLLRDWKYTGSGRGNQGTYRKYFRENFEKRNSWIRWIDSLEQEMSILVIRPNSQKPYQLCTCYVMDITDEDIMFDSSGVCERCKEYKELLLPEWNHGRGHEKELQALLDQIKVSGKLKKYDCILRLLGGLDNSYMLHLAVKGWGLHPFVFHIIAGWNLPVAEEKDEYGYILYGQKHFEDLITKFLEGW